MKRVLCLILLIVFLPAMAAAQSLKNGDRGQKVTQLQTRLQELGLTTGAADGIYGKQTAAAVQEAQRLLAAAGYNISETGAADETTLALIYDTKAEDALLTLRNGSKGEAVTKLQQRLQSLKLLAGYADGHYGSMTEDAVRTFQLRMSELGVVALTPDGVASPAVQELLYEDLSVYGFQAPVYFDESKPLALTADDLYSSACILIDAPTGKVLFSHEADAQMYPASTTKIMTLLLAIESGNLDKTIRVPECAADIPADSSRVPVYPGEKMTMRDLLHGLMIRSGNDAANAVAELCDGSIEAFVGRMNARAQQLGMTSTHFVNPHGYHDEQHYSSARDLATLTRLGLTDPTFCQIVTCLQYTLPATSRRDELLLQSTHEIFDPLSEYWIPSAAGVKSGFTSFAGFCYVGAAQKEGRTLIAVILDAPGRTYGWTDLRRLFAYGFANE